jgi:tetratricopeptide (TPR) repeat protein
LLDDIFELQDKVAISVAGVIEPTLQAAETARSAARPTNDLTAYDLYLRAYALALSSAMQITKALGLLQQAIERDPYYGPALAYAAVCCYRLIQDGRSEDPQADNRKGVEFARRALRVAGDDPGTLVNASVALAYFGEELGPMMALVDRSLALHPSFARGWYMSGFLRLCAGQSDTAIEHIAESLRLSPRARIGTTLAAMGGAYFVNRRFDEAVQTLLLAIQEDPDFPMPYRFLAASYAHMGRLNEARDVIQELRTLTRAVFPPNPLLRNPDHRELFLSGLRIALGEET